MLKRRDSDYHILKTIISELENSSTTCLTQVQESEINKIHHN